MAAAPKTRNSLLLRLRDTDDAAAWEEFVGIYQPVIVRLAMSRGLQHADADDLAQHVLVSVSHKVSEWHQDPQRGQFRTWLSRVIRNAALNMLTRRKADRGMGGTSALALINGKTADVCSDAEVFDLEARREAFRWAADQVQAEFQPQTWDAFWLTAVEGLTVAESGRRTGKSVGAVYVARSRVMTRLQKKVKALFAADSEEAAQ